MIALRYDGLILYASLMQELVQGREKAIGMLELRSDSLVVSILDPNDPADADKNGARYCTGGPRHPSAFTLSE